MIHRESIAVTKIVMRIGMNITDCILITFRGLQSSHPLRGRTHPPLTDKSSTECYFNMFLKYMLYKWILRKKKIIKILNWSDFNSSDWSKRDISLVWKDITWHSNKCQCFNHKFLFTLGKYNLLIVVFTVKDAGKS